MYRAIANSIFSGSSKFAKCAKIFRFILVFFCVLLLLAFPSKYVMTWSIFRRVKVGNGFVYLICLNVAGAWFFWMVPYFALASNSENRLCGGRPAWPKA